MTTYSSTVERHMKVFYESLSEKDRRRYAAIEAEKLGHGGLDYISHVLDCDPKTIWHGKQDVEALPKDEAESRIRKKGGPSESYQCNARTESQLQASRPRPHGG